MGFRTIRPDRGEPAASKFFVRGAVRCVRRRFQKHLGLVSLVGAILVSAGCTSRGQMEILESRLRRQEDSINELHQQLKTTESQLEVARREARELKSQLASGRVKTARVEQIGALGQVEGITFNKFFTGGLDRDGKPGDEIFSAEIVPVDAEGNLVKVPGSLVLTVLDLSQPEDQQRLGRWEYSSEQSEHLWHSGFLGSGYVVRVPWQKVPQSPSLLVHARLKTVDGRQFDASQAIRIVPPVNYDGALPRIAADPAEKSRAGDPSGKANASNAAFWNGVQR